MTELDEAHARIQELKDRIAGRRPAGPSRRRRALLAGAYLLALAVIAIAAVMAIFPRRTIVVIGAPPAPPPGIAPGTLRWRAGEVFRDRGPLLVDVDGDGLEDVVGLAWRDLAAGAPLHVVAFDRKTYAVVWRAGPFPAQWRDGVVRIEKDSDVSLAVLDGLGTRHVLDLATGAEMAAIPVGVPSEEARRAYRNCPPDRTLPCTETSSDEITARAGRVLGEPGFGYDLVDGAARVTLASVTAPEGRREEHALRWDAASKKLMFNVPLVPKGPENRVSFTPNAWSALGRGRLLHLYESGARSYRLAMRDATSGKLAYDVPVPSLHDGSAIGAMTADRDEVFIVADESLLVLDATTGTLTHRLHRF